MTRDLSENCLDEKLKVGCVIVKDDVLISEGWNRLPDGIDTVEARQTHRPAIYLWTEHAERVALYNAARNGRSTEGATAYVSVSPYSVCTVCLRGLLESGITRIVGTAREIARKEKHKGQAEINNKMIQESGIETIIIE